MEMLGCSMAPFCLRAEWRCVEEECLVLSVMTSGMSWMPKSSVDSWDMTHQVCLHRGHLL